VPLYFAAERPVVERDGHADHGRRRPHAAAPGRGAEMRKVRFRTLGCYPLTGAVESDRRHAARHHPGDAADHHSERQGRVIDHDAGSMEKKKQEGTSDGTPRSAFFQGATSIAYLDAMARRTSTRPAALHHLRLGGRRQEHPDRPPALRIEDALRGPARRARSRLKKSAPGRQIDFALLVDGLAAEREQGITIDVAYRFFSTDKRKFIVADTPGHEQYTRNMVTGASTADSPSS
jgi:hypothetical protein